MPQTFIPQCKLSIVINLRFVIDLQCYCVAIRGFNPISIEWQHSNNRYRNQIVSNDFYELNCDGIVNGLFSLGFSIEVKQCDNRFLRQNRLKIYVFIKIRCYYFMPL